MKLERIARDVVHCVRLPDWIDHQPYRTDIPETDASCITNGLCRLLYDAQVDLRNGEPVWHCRTIQRVLTREGAERVAHVVVEFDPGFQRIEFHSVRVLRGDEAIEHARVEAFQLLRRETNMERLIFDGRLTASLVIPDVRIDDIVEVGVTVYGGVPVLGGRHVAWVVFDSFNPWFEYRHRLLRPLARDVLAKAYNGPPQPVVTVTGQTEDVRWLIIGQQRRAAELLTPSWSVLHPTLQFSEFKSWNEVARLLTPLYEGDALPAALAEEVDRLAAAYREPDQRAVEWLRFVQRELRYFAFSLGEGGLAPRAFDAIWSTRFGDCKDAASLYVAGVRRMGLDACAALISTTHGYSLNRFLPSTTVFDHCIVCLRLNGNSYWLDPTVPVQSGTLQNIFQPHAGWALPLSPQTTDLERLTGEEPLHILHWEDKITVGPKTTSPAVVRRKIDYSFWGADAMRNRIANDGANGFAQGMLRELQVVWPGATEIAPMDIRDDKDRNRLTLVLTYEVRDCWKPANDESRLNLAVAIAVSKELQPILAELRDADILLGRPRKLTSFVQLNMPRNWFGGGWSRRVEASRAAYVDNFTSDGRTITHSREVVIGAWSLPATEAQTYNEIAKKLQEDLLLIWARERFGSIRPWLGTKGRLVQGLVFVWYAAWGAWLLIFLIKIILAPR